MYSESPLEYQSTRIRNDGFWSDIDCGHFEKTRDIPPRISHSLITDALITAVVMVNLRLSGYKTRQTEKGICHSSDIEGAVAYVPPPAQAMRADTPDGNYQPVYNAAQALYLRAVYAMALGDLMSAAVPAGSGGDRWPREHAEEQRAQLLTESNMAIRALMGVPRASVALIE